MTDKKKLFFVVTEDWYFYSHRLPMARAAQRAGFDVSVITNVDQHKERIEAENIRVIPLSLHRKSLNPVTALCKINQLRGIYKKEKPDLVHHIAMKPVLFGSIAAWLSGVPRVLNAFAGLGYVFYGQGIKAKILKAGLLPLFRFFLKRPDYWLLLQNHDDRALLEKYALIPKHKTIVIKGSGVNLENYVTAPLPAAEPDIICAFAGRMIEIKGLPTLRAAFRRLKERAPHIKLWLCGTPDPANPGAWTQETLQEWAQEPNIVYKGQCDDMAAIWAQSHIAVQASYGGEGLPKSLLEAASCGRAIVTTSTPGCREVVKQDLNGVLVAPYDEKALADAIERTASDFKRLEKMGAESRELAETEFADHVISAQTEDLYRQIVDKNRYSHLE